MNKTQTALRAFADSQPSLLRPTPQLVTPLRAEPTEYRFFYGCPPEHMATITTADRKSSLRILVVSDDHDLTTQTAAMLVQIVNGHQQL